jgi:hypothetical protein
MLGATTHFRFQEPMLFVLSKADRVDPESIGTIRDWAADPASLESDVLGESPGMATEFAASVSRLLAGMAVESTLVAVSSVDGTGLDDLYTLFQGAVGESEDATPEYDTFLSGDREEGKDGSDEIQDELN